MKMRKMMMMRMVFGRIFSFHNDMKSNVKNIVKASYNILQAAMAAFFLQGGLRHPTNLTL